MFGMSSEDALVFDMDANPRQRSMERAEARAHEIRTAIRRVRRQYERVSARTVEALGGDDDQPVDLDEPPSQYANPDQQRMHDKYANGRAAKIDMLRTEYPSHLVPEADVSHRYR